MKKVYVAAFNALKKMGCPVFVNDNNTAYGNFSISAEENDQETWAEYYCQSWGIFGVSPKIDDTLTSKGLFCEWENPGKLNVYIC
jgi:hypothetical protein